MLGMMGSRTAATCAPVALCQVSGMHQILHVCKDETSEKAVAIATCTPNGPVHGFQLLDLGKKD